jgi:hypothetical protein
MTLRSNRYWAVGMDSNKADPRSAARSQVTGEDQGMGGIELGSNPINQASAAATLVTTGQLRSMRGGS